MNTMLGRVDWAIEQAKAMENISVLSLILLELYALKLGFRNNACFNARHLANRIISTKLDCHLPTILELDCA